MAASHHRDPMTRRFLMGAAATLVLAMGAGCGTTDPGMPGDWTRAFASSCDRVWEVTLRTLEDLGYEVVHSDRSRGRIVADLERSREHRAMELRLLVEELPELVRVDVSTGPSRGLDARPDLGMIRLAVVDLLDEIERRVHGAP